MKPHFLFLVIPSSLLAMFCPLPAPAQTLLFGDCYPTGMAMAVTACTDGLTGGVRQPQVLRRPGFPAEVTSEDSLYTLPTQLDERYASFAFDAVTATRDGYHHYRYPALNDPGRLLVDSVYVRLKRNGQPTDPPLPPDDTVITPPDTIISPPDTIVVPPTPAVVPADTGISPPEASNPPVSDPPLEPVMLPIPLIVNLVIIDQHGLHNFKILNADAFTRLDLTLYDRRGLVFYHNDDYRNDYDMSRLPADTYYFRLLAHTPDGSVEKKGFVELVKPKR